LTLKKPPLYSQSSPDEVARLRDCITELAAANERLTNEVAELRQIEQALRANELNFQLTVDSMPGMVHTMTAAGAVEFVNRQILDFFGKTVEELERWDMLLHPDDRPRAVDLWALGGDRRAVRCRGSRAPCRRNVSVAAFTSASAARHERERRPLAQPAGGHR
jgi:PAS domain-containing protein